MLFFGKQVHVPFDQTERILPGTHKTFKALDFIFVGSQRGVIKNIWGQMETQLAMGTRKCRGKFCHLFFGVEQFLPELTKGFPCCLNKDMHVLPFKFDELSELPLKLYSSERGLRGLSTEAITFSLKPRFLLKKASQSFLSLPSFCHMGSMA